MITMKRLFVAVPVSESIKEKIKPLAKALEDTGADLKPVSLENMHFTLKFLGEVEESKIPEIKEKLGQIAKSSRKFELRLKEVGVFPSLERINVVWIGAKSPECVSLMKEANEQLRYIRKDEHEEEMPHLTIARVKSARNKEKLVAFVDKFKKEELGQMSVDKILLCESELTPEGPKYTVIDEWMLEI